MDWKAKEEDRQALARIAGLLVALAQLAEYACGRSRPLRCLILWILRPAEHCARTFVGGEALPAWGGIDLLEPTGGTVAELMRLAASLRALALAVRRLARRMHRLGGQPTPSCDALRHLSQLVLRAPGGQAALHPVDTS